MHRHASVLLDAEANRLFDEAATLVPVVRTGEPLSQDVREQIPHFALICDYIRAQEDVVVDDFRLPEPILHPIFRPDVLVVSLNPSDDPDEEIPRLGDGLDAYAPFYATRFADCRRINDSRTGKENQPANRERSLGSHRTGM